MSNIVHLQFGDEDASNLVDRAAKIVAALELDGDLKVPAFEKVVDLLAGRHLVVEAPQPIGMPLMPPLVN